MKYAAFFTGIFAIVSIMLMLNFAAGRECIYVNASKNSGIAGQDVKDFQFDNVKKELAILMKESEASPFCVPVLNTTKEIDITIKNDYVKHKLYITINELPQDYYNVNSLIGNGDFVTHAFYAYQKGVTYIELQMNQMYEHDVMIKNSKIYLDFSKPREKYDNIIVVDAGHGGPNTGITVEWEKEKEIALEITKKLKELLDQTGIRVYYTRLEDNDVKEIDRVSLANQVDADMLISIHTAYNNLNTEEFGIKAIYNSNYFIPQFGSIQLADTLEKSIIKECGTNALGLEAAKEGNILVHEATVPVVFLEVGVLSNDKERKMLSNDEYLGRIAIGIYNGIMESYEILEQK